MKARGTGFRYRVALLPLSFLLLTAVMAQPTEPIRELWQRPLASALCLAISPDGSRTAVVSWTGEVRCWEGRRLSWQRAIPGAEAVVLGVNGRALVYTPLNALRRDLLVLDGNGRPSGRFTAGAPITAAALSPDGRTAAVGTASGGVEIHLLDGQTPPSRIALPGSVQQLCYDEVGNVVTTTADPAWLAVLSPSGRVQWRYPAPGGCELRIGTPPLAGPTARFAGGTAARALPVTVAAVVPADAPLAGGDPTRQANEPGPAASVDPDRIELAAFSTAGRPIWRQTLAGRDPHLSIMGGSGSVVVAYERAERRGLILRHDRSLACFASDGSRRWEQGGMLYQPLLVCASSREDAVLSLGASNRFWLLSGRGQNLWSYTTAAPIRMARGSADGAAVAVATSDGKLSLLKISPGGGKANSQ